MPYSSVLTCLCLNDNQEIDQTAAAGSVAQLIIHVSPFFSVCDFISVVSPLRFRLDNTKSSAQARVAVPLVFCCRRSQRDLSALLFVRQKKETAVCTNNERER